MGSKKLRLFLICFIFVTCIAFGMYLYKESKVEINGYIFNTNTKTLNLSNMPMTNEKELEDKLSRFCNLNTIIFGNHTLDQEELERLQNKYPNVDFNAIVTRKLYGKTFRQDATSLDFTDVVVDENIIEYIEYFPNLKEVNLYNQNIDRELKKQLVNKYLNITFKWYIMVNGVKYDTNTSWVDFSTVSFESLHELYETVNLFQNLKSIYLGDSNFTNNQLGQMREDFPDIKIDWLIHLGKWTLRTDAVAFGVLIKFDSYVPLTSYDLEPLKYCTELEALDLGHQMIDDVSIIADNLPKLRILILADNRITDISPLSKLKKLQYLEVFLNRVEDLTPLANLTNLIDLNISYNLTLSNIDPILNLPKLERLWLVNIPVSDYNFNRLREAYPAVEMERFGYGSTGGTWRTHPRYFAMIDMYYNNYVSDLFTKYDNN